MSDYPIPVRDYSELHPADRAVCEQCGAEFPWDVAEGDPYDMCSKHACGGQVVMKYIAVDWCQNCGALGEAQVGPGYCSRACKLQAEYAKGLARS